MDHPPSPRRAKRPVQGQPIPIRGTRIDPFGVLLHPAWLISLGLLALNDHWFKHVYPGIVTGKLSDFVGLLVAPWVLCALFWGRSRRAVIVAHGAIAVVFAAINLSPTVAAGFSALTGLVGFPWSITVDPTDLIALPMVIVSYVYLLPIAARSRVSVWALSRKIYARTAFFVGALACMATSPPDPDPLPIAAWPIMTDAYLTNQTDAVRLVRLRSLAPGIQLDCDLIATDPSALLARSVFGETVVYQVFPMGILPLAVASNVNDCTAYLIDGDGLPMRLLFWTAADLPMRSTVSDDPKGRVELQVQTATSVVLSNDTTLTVNVVFPAPPPEPEPASPGCTIPSAEDAVVWELPVPLGTYTLTDIWVAPDGCAALELLGPQEKVSQWFVCLPYGMLTVEPRQSVTITTPMETDLSMIHIEWETGFVKAAIGGRVVPMEGLNTVIHESEECGWTHDECGTLIRPLSVGSAGLISAVPTKITDAPVNFEGETTTLVITRAITVGMSGTVCLDPTVGVSDHYIESVIVGTKEN